jgi:Fe-S cluster biogenesis protein NfuA
MSIPSQITEKIEEAIAQLRPFLEADGGDITLVEVTPDMIAKVKLHGACSSCSMSLMTLKAGLEDAIKRAVPQIISVEAINLPEAAQL